MAGHLFIEELREYEFKAIISAGGILEGFLYHSDVYSWEVLSQQLKIYEEERRKPKETRNYILLRKGLPAHAYITFTKNNTLQEKLTTLIDIFARVTQPLTIVKQKSGLENWDEKNKTEKITALYSSIQNGDVKLEFYKYNFMVVRKSMSGLTPKKENVHEEE